jgi:hypothetical protein
MNADAKKALTLDASSKQAAANVARLEPAVHEKQEREKAEMLGSKPLISEALASNCNLQFFLKKKFTWSFCSGKLKDLGNTLLGKFGLSTDNFKINKDDNSGSYNISFQK